MDIRDEDNPEERVLEEPRTVPVERLLATGIDDRVNQTDADGTDEGLR